MKRAFVMSMLIFVLVITAQAQQTSNYVLQAVPGSTNIKLDGKVDDWDLSGEILMCNDLASLADKYSLRAAAMYDKDFLYLSFRFKDKTPMLNQVDPKIDKGAGWRADSIELRVKTDIVSNWQCWYYTDRKEACLWGHYGVIGWEKDPDDKDFPEPLKEGAREAFTQDPDGNGYTQELAIPWKLLTRDGHALKAGDSMRLGIQSNWGDASGGIATGMPEHRIADLISKDNPQREFFWTNQKAWGELLLVAKGSLPPSESVAQLSMVEKYRQSLYSTEGPVKIEYELPSDGHATLVIEDKDGKRVRNLIGNYPRNKGANLDYWDGRSDSGDLVQPGKYKVRGLFHGDLDVLYEFSYGNPGNPPWYTADGKGGWLANHTNPIAVLADEKRIYVAAPTAEGPHPLMALDYDGNKVWGGLARWAAGFMARQGKYLYVVAEKDPGAARKKEDLDAMAEIELIRIDPETGREVLFPDGKSRHVIAKWNIQKEGTIKKWEGWTNANKAHDADWAGINAQGLASMGDNLYASLHFSGKLLKIDAEKGEVVGEIPMAKPAGLASDGQQLFVITGNKIVKLKPDGAVEPFVQENLKAPIGIALDKKRNVYVSDWADQMCVKVFSPDGKHLKNIGKLGGRALVGPYDSSGMFLPRGVSVDTQGRLWVAEDDFQPRRVSCWNPDGTLAIEKLGGCYYSAMSTYIFPDEPDKALSMGNLVELDWEKGIWRVLGSPWRTLQENALLGLDYRSDIGSTAFHDVKGRRFIIHTANNSSGAIVVSEWKNERAYPLAAIGSCASAMVNTIADWKAGFEPAAAFAEHLWSEPRMNETALKEIPWFFRGPMAGGQGPAWTNAYNIWQKSGMDGKAGYPNNNAYPNGNFVWCDLNGNGLQDGDEVKYYPTPKLEGALPSSWGPEYWSHGVCDKDLTLYLTAVQRGKSYHFRLPVARWAESGAPVYEPEKAELIVTSQYLGEAAWVNEKGQLLAYGNIGNPNRSYLSDPLVMFNPDGSIAWTYPNDYVGVQGSHRAPKSRHGLLIGELGVIGTAKVKELGGIFAFQTNMGQAVMFTEDGLYLGELFVDCRSGADPLPDVPRRGMSVMNTTPGGEWFGGQFFQNRKNGNIYVVGIGRENGGIGRVTGLETAKRISPRSIDFTQDDYSAASELLAKKAKESKDGNNLKISALKKPAAVLPDAASFSWGKDTSCFWRYDENRSAEASWTYDDKNLYLCFRDVKDDTPMINSGEDVRQLFKFGDAVLMELRTVADDASDTIIPGDLRILFSVQQGKPLAVLYDYKVKGVQEPVHFKSVKDTVVDVVKVLDKAEVVIERKEGAYSLRASIPLKEIGFAPVTGKKYKGDFGIVHSDKTGMINTLRMNWANKATGLVSDLSLEADITPQMWGWFEVK
ncbi:MAG: hypothetical protein WAX69_06125 [Victivallales bacterium]